MSSNAPSELPAPGAAQKRNARLALWCAAGFALMIGVSFASVPLYRAFCQLTGFDGTARRAETASATVLKDEIVVRFDANVRGGLPWSFKALQTSQPARLGETKLAFFKITNNSDKPITGRAVYNVVPEQAGPHFRKLQCFCFEDLTIKPGETVEAPVLYFIEPAYAQDFETKGKKEVTLSYTFFPSTTAQAAAPKKPEKIG